MMNEKQKLAILSAYLDLIGSMEETYGEPHDWRGHLSTIKEVRDAFEPILKGYNCSTTYYEDLIQGKIAKDIQARGIVERRIIS